MYVPSTGPSAQGLLLAYEAHPELFRDGDLNIPESGNPIPDLLDEAKRGLDWVLCMQAPDGGFHLRETTITQSETPGPARHAPGTTPGCAGPGVLFASQVNTVNTFSSQDS